MEYLSEKNWVEKSKTLIYAEWSKFNIHELQIFETYLSRINPRDPDSSCVRFTRKEYAKMMGYADGRNLKTKMLDKWIRNFMSKQITINYGNGDKRHVNLFSDATVHKDIETGEIVIDLDCNVKLKPVFFDIAKKGYISYHRRNTINFKSEYTLKLYCMLKDHAWGNFEWTIDLKELRNMLGATEQLYEKFAEFNRRILKKAQEEISQNSDIDFVYERIVKGRLTRAIKFKIRNKSYDNINEIEKEDFEVIEKPAEEFDWTQYQGMKNEYFMVTMKEINMDWNMTEAQCDYIVDKIYSELILTKENIMEMSLNEVNSLKMEIINKVLKFAAAGNAKNLYKWLKTDSVWQSIVKEIK